MKRTRILAVALTCAFMLSATGCSRFYRPNAERGVPGVPEITSRVDDNAQSEMPPVYLPNTADEGKDPDPQ